MAALCSVPACIASKEDKQDATSEPDTMQDTSGPDVLADFLSELMGDSTYDDCPERGEFGLRLEWDPHPMSRSASPGIVSEVTENPAGMLEIGVDLASGDHEPGAYTFKVPLLAGVAIDLHPGDEVTVTTFDLTGCIGCPILELMIERDGDLVLYALDCANYVCTEPSFELGPLDFELITGICPPWADAPYYGGDEWCFIKEDVGLEVSCLDGSGTEHSARLFVGQQAALDCGGSIYHVAAGTQTRVLACPEDFFCFDHIQDERDLLIIKG